MRREEKRRRKPPCVYVQNASVCTVRTSPCVPATGPNVLDIRACCRYTRRRPDRTHGGVLNVHTGGFSARQASPTPHAHTHKKQHTTHTTDTLHRTHNTHTPQHTRTHNTTCTHQHDTTTQTHTQTCTHNTTCTHQHDTHHSTSNIRPRSFKVPFLLKTVTSVTSVIFFADLLFSILYKSVTSVI